jgi:hypothetical protein
MAKAMATVLAGQISAQRVAVNKLVSSGADKVIIEKEKEILADLKRKLRNLADGNINLHQEGPVIHMVSPEKSFSDKAREVLDKLDSFKVQSSGEAGDLLSLVNKVNQKDYFFDYTVDTANVKQKITNIKRRGTDILKDIKSNKQEKAIEKIDKNSKELKDVSYALLEKIVEVEEVLIKSSCPEDAGILERIVAAKYRLLAAIAREANV